MINPSLSICIPTYNRSKELDETLFFATKFSKNYDFVKEILVLDNNEDDKAKRPIDKYLKKYAKLKYIKNPYNIGGHENFKKCIETAKGDFVWILTDDDVLFEHSLETISQNLKKDIDCLIINWNLYDQSLNKLVVEDVIKSDGIFSDNKNFLLSEFYTKLTYVSSIIFKKEDFMLLVDDDLYDKYTPYGLTCVLTAYSIFLKENCKVVYENIPIIKQRGNNDAFLRDNTNNFYNVFSAGMNLFHKNFLEIHYEKKSVKTSKKKTFYFFIFHNLINEKIYHKNFGLAFSSAYYNYKDIFTIKILLLLIYITPVNLILFLKNTRKIIAK